MIQRFKDSQYADGVVPVDALRNKRGFVLKWDEGKPTQTSTNSDALSMFKPGFKQQAEADSFIAEVTEDSVIFDNATFRPMDTIEFDYSFMDAQVPLQSMRAVSSGSQIQDITKLEEGTPSFRRKSLFCKPLLAYTIVPWLWVQDNIEGDRFLSSFQSLVAERIKFNMELISLYGKENTSAGADGLNTMDGMIQQLTTQHDKIFKGSSASLRTPQGVFSGISGEANTKDPVKIDFSKRYDTDGQDPISQLEDMITQFGIQKGNVGNAKFYMSNEARAKLIQIAQSRETVVADSLYFEGEDLKIWGTPIVTCDALERPVNGFKTNVILADLASYVIGMKRDVETDSEFNMRSQTYDSVTKVYFDNLVLREKDILTAECSNLPSQKATSSGTSSGSGSSSGS